MGRTNPPLAAPVLVSFALAAAFAIAADGGPVALAAWSRPPPGRASIPTIRSGSTTTAPSTRRRRCRPRPATSTTSSSTRSCRPASASIGRRSTSTRSTRCPTRAGSPTASGGSGCRARTLVRGPDRRARPDIQDWPIVAGKAEGVQPGYRVQDPEKHLWQIEFDPPAHPEMASAAEVIGTAIYHALGYHVVEVYVADVDPAKIRIAPNARMRVVTAPKGVRSFVQRGPRRGAGPRRAPSRRPRPRPRQPLRRGIAARQLPLQRASAPTIPTTSSRTSTGASCAPTACSRPG